MSPKFFLSNHVDWTTPENKKLVEQFKLYKSEGVVPDSFGKDASLTRPRDALYAGIQHMHIGHFNKVNNQFHRTSDDWLIYAEGLFSDSYLLIEVLSPDAHDRSENLEVMSRYIKLGNAFRNKY
ncbi:type II toxin-antitoxin system YafO family toxin [Vibrio hannami]|uniref:type II toxin-antitoxin system YafO family toxin n=1 Tax=Vibrio hannami TaxID=2717094 RepID=UPI00240F0B53|nr:type II toxin-antitoxin system YafO family toxin [Vibrio hannami]MDG3088123.1 type II toxin-antitoxin system YafO family toxin [Vibrio hannami]